MFAETKGIIIYSRDHREKDKLVKIFTEKYGKLVFYVKGAHRKNNPLLSAILPMTEATYAGEMRKDGLSFLNSVKFVAPYTYLQEDIFANAYATYVLALADAAIEDHKAEPYLFTFIEKILTRMNEKNDPEILANIFEVQILERFGVGLHLDSCAVCGKTHGPFDFSMKYSGLICQEHFNLDERRLHLTAKAGTLLQLFSNLPVNRIGKINVSEATKKSLRFGLDEIYDEYVGVHLKSKHFIDQMKNWEKLMTDD